MKIFKEKKIPESIGFNIYEDYLLTAFYKYKQVKIRLALLRALNLTAQTNETDFKRKLAGYIARSSANPYPYIIVGDGKNDSNNCKFFLKIIIPALAKFVDDKVSTVHKNLNPNFFNTYQLDAYFPADWKLSLIIKNNAGFFTDKEIGSKDFDLEDRFFGNPTRLHKMAYELR